LGRDFSGERSADVTLVSAGESCVQCGGVLVEERGLELGHTFKLGTKYSTPMAARYLGPDGRECDVVMGCYGIGLDRLLTGIVESSHDSRGIIWPSSVAPYQVYLLGLNLDNPDTLVAAETLYRELQHRNVEVLYDDRLESPGVKFADADLIGLPLRVTVSQRSQRQGAVELTPRRGGASFLVPMTEAVERIAEHPAI
jgi:prolyl-tRNA synthetase